MHNFMIIYIISACIVGKGLNLLADWMNCRTFAVRNKCIDDMSKEFYGLLLPLVFDAAALIFYIPTLFLNRKRVRPKTFSLGVIGLLLSLFAPFIMTGSMFLSDNPPSMLVFWTMYYAINSYPVLLMTAGGLLILHDIYKLDKMGK